MAYRLEYSETSRGQIRHLHPHIKSLVKNHIHTLRENPYSGKALEKELSGYHSLRTRRFRIIYKVDHDMKVIQIHYVGHRKDVYELFRQIMSRE